MFASVMYRDHGREEEFISVGFDIEDFISLENLQRRTAANYAQ